MPHTVTTYAPYPPKGTQIAIGPGTVTHVCVAVPRGGENGNNPMAYPVYAIAYDSASGAGDTSTPILCVPSAWHTGPCAVVFEKGLYIHQETGSSLEITYEPGAPDSAEVAQLTGDTALLRYVNTA